MKIYINNFNLEILNDIEELFKEHLVNSETYIQLYTNEGIYQIENKNIYFIDVCDKDIKIVENYYNDFTIVVDPSIINRRICSSIYGETHLNFQLTRKYFKLNKSSNISLIFKYSSDDEGKKLKPIDIYFECDKDADVNDTFIKNELIEFLSVLN